MVTCLFNHFHRFRSSPTLPSPSTNTHTHLLPTLAQPHTLTSPKRLTSSNTARFSGVTATLRMVSSSSPGIKVRLRPFGSLVSSPTRLSLRQTNPHGTCYTQLEHTYVCTYDTVTDTCVKHKVNRTGPETRALKTLPATIYDPDALKPNKRVDSARCEAHLSARSVLALCLATFTES